MRALRTLVLLAAGLTLRTPPAAGDAGAKAGIQPPQAAQEAAKPSVPRQVPRRLADVATKPNPRDPFMFGASTT